LNGTSYFYFAFDGINTILVPSGNQPEIVQPFESIDVIRHNAWSDGAYIISANDNIGGDVIALKQTGSTPTLGLFAGSDAASNSDLALAAWGIVSSLFDGANSGIKVGGGTRSSGDPGPGEISQGLFMGGQFPLAHLASFDIVEHWLVSNMPADGRTELYAYYNSRYGL
jgi:hypothetical protein